jgi:predicted DNA-binding protein
MAVKTEVVAIKVSPEEKEKIKALAAQQDMTVSKYLYKLLIKNMEEK